MILSAAEAREKTLNEISKKDKDQLEEISVAVERAAHAGEFSANFFFNPTSRVIKKLAEAGYDVKQNKADRDPCWNVSWEDVPYSGRFI